jgi:hypothetical protein
LMSLLTSLTGHRLHPRSEMRGLAKRTQSKLVVKRLISRLRPQALHQKLLRRDLRLYRHRRSIQKLKWPLMPLGKSQKIK